MTIVGIDLGTTHSLIGLWSESTHAPELVPNPLGSLLTPSVVSLDDDEQLLVGEAALDRLVSHPERSTSLFKRLMGTDRKIQLGGRSLRSEELSAMVIRQLLSDLEAHTGERPDEAVISVPAYFSDAQRKATKVAGEIAGVKVERLVNEPTAAALAYGLQEAADEITVAVVDLGGGTLDVSILEYFSGVMQVRASTGDRTLGGIDFDRQLVEWLLAENQIAADKLNPQARAQLTRRVIQAKHQLSTAQEAQISFSQSSRFNTQAIDAVVSRGQFEKICEPLLKRLTQTIERAMRDSGLSAASLDKVLLVGGATRMPMVRSLVGRLFQQLPLSHINADQVVAEGAVVQAALRAERRELEDVVLTDVAPYTLGIDIAVEKNGDYEGGHYLPIIERNSPVPISRVETVSPTSEKQKTILCHIYQGESRLVKNNVLLGKLEQKIPKGGDTSIDVRFTYDVNGILEVTSKIQGTEQEKRIVISGNANGMSETEIESALAKLGDLKVHPRDRMENRTLIARAERMYEEALGDRREHISRLIAWFEGELAAQDAATAATAGAQLLEQLNALDADPFA